MCACSIDLVGKAAYNIAYAAGTTCRMEPMPIIFLVT